MEDETSVQYENLKRELLEQLHAPLEKEVAEQKKYLEDTEALYQSYVVRINRIDSKNGIGKYINETNWLKKELYNQLEKEYPSRDDADVYSFYKDFFTSLSAHLKTLPEEIKEEQKRERFSFNKQDSLSILFLKSFKVFFFHISRVPFYLINPFRKEKKRLRFWSHKIPVRAMQQHYLGNILVSKSLDQFRQLQQLKCNARTIKWQINSDINVEVAALLDKDDINFDELIMHLQTMSERKRIKEVIDNFSRKINIWKEETEIIIQESIDEFQAKKLIVGTLELNRNKFSVPTLESNRKQFEGEFKTILNGWKNTQYAQIDDFQIDLELYQIKYCGLMQFFLLQSSCRSRVNKTVIENIQSIKEEVNQVTEHIIASSSLEEIKALLITEKIKLSHELKVKKIPQAIHALYEQNFPQLINRMDHKIRLQLGEMKNRRIIYSKETYESPLSKSSLSHFNPKELVEVDIINPFSKNLQKVITQLNTTLESTANELKNLCEIIDYNLETAINSVDNELELAEVQNIAKEGLERAGAKVENLESELHGISQLVDVNLKKELNDLNVYLLKLTHNENITNLRIQLAKAKAVEKTKAYRQEIFLKIKNFIPIALRLGRRRYGQLVVLFKEFQERIGLIETENELTTELSDFLIQTEEAIQKLPYIYRRLYEIKSLDEESFFEGRNEELTKLNSAYENWQEGKTSSAVLVGEKGSGLSSLINLFARQNSTTNITRHQLIECISSEKDFLTFFKVVFPDNKFDSFEEIASFLNKGNSRLIILEDIQHFFLKKPHGFEAINLLFELISHTSKKVFWLVGTTTFAWSYLQKTIAIERYIKHKIVLTPLSDRQIINLITKRHRVSGYNLKFINNTSKAQDKKRLVRLSKKETQESLRKSFFEDLNDFAQSNISLALLYWLRSTSAFEENTVIIGKVINVKFNFLNSLDKGSTFTLHALLLHESLTVKEHAEIFHQEEKQSRMNLMVLEDGGILKMKNGRYTINQLLYRQVINALRNKNLIH